MLNLNDLFQWERFITPSIVKLFFWLAVILSAFAALCGLANAVTLMGSRPLVGLVTLVVSVLGFAGAVVLARVVAEFVLIVFRINEHLGAIRNRGGEAM
jgi:hypothetical protein